MRYLLFLFFVFFMLSCEEECPKEDPCDCSDRQTSEYDDLPPTGSEGGVCYPNLTCNDDLICVDHFCEKN